ncbi:MAG: AmmeMemoRadiSam system radical SAM enzyme [Phycisphaerales bacterium]|nr:AmmeMemoRadiSam system radical SAM enzyme [Phycisphaerales bacterium]
MRASVSLTQLLGENTADSAPELVQLLAGGAVRCVACGHRCVVRPGRAGTCRVRFNDNGTLRVPWGYVSSLQVDPIEKKPFFHAFPGRDALSFGMLGCDFHCGYCQNWVTSQSLRDPQAGAQPSFVKPEELVEIAVRRGAPVMVSTYNEPLITADWAVAVFKPARERGIVCGFVSNGNVTREVLEYIRPYVDLYKIDLKGFDDRHYRELGGVLENTLEGIRLTHALGFWVEVVTLLVPGFNDSDDEIRKMADFVASVSPDIPWHLTAFHPDYKMLDSGRTPVETLLRAHAIGKSAGLRFVYAGNAPGSVGNLEDTVCPDCGETLIRRVGFTVRENCMRGSACGKCGAKIPGVWEENAAEPRVGSVVPLSFKSC